MTQTASDSTSTDDASSALSAIRSTILIVGTKSPKGPHFMIANWGTQASFDPWRYVIALKKEAHTTSYAKSHDAFTINLVTKDDKEPSDDQPTLTSAAIALDQALERFAELGSSARKIRMSLL